MTTAFDTHSYLEELSATIRLLALPTIDRLVQVLLQAYYSGRTIFLFGNGCSASPASHMTSDPGKGTIPQAGKRLRAVAPTDNVALIRASCRVTEGRSRL